MRLVRIFSLLLGLATLAAYCGVRADQWDKTTKVTFGEAVQVPGTVLPPGSYVFKLAETTSYRHVVQIFNDDNTRLVTTVMAVPNELLEPSGKTILTYAERPVDQPVALNAWFYPGDNFGQQFVYPRSEALQLARLNRTEVPSSGAEGQSQQSQQTFAENGAPVEPAAESAARSESAYSNPAPSTASAAPEPNPTPAPARASQQPVTELPHTASSLPLLGLMGLAFISIAAFLRLLLLVRA